MILSLLRSEVISRKKRSISISLPFLKMSGIAFLNVIITPLQVILHHLEFISKLILILETFL